MTLLTGTAWTPSDDDGTGQAGTSQDATWWAAVKTSLEVLLHSATNPTVSPVNAIDELVLARGSQLTLKARLDNAMDAAGNSLVGAATELVAGIVSIAAQNFAGIKTFYSPWLARLATGVSTTGGAVIHLVTTLTPVANVGVAETDLMTVTIPANTLDANGKSLVFIVAFRMAANANNKTIKPYYAGVVLETIGPATFNGHSGCLLITIRRTGATTARFSVQGSVGNAGGGAYIAITQEGSITISSTIDQTFKLTGTSGTASADITQNILEAVLRA